MGARGVAGLLVPAKVIVASDVTLRMEMLVGQTQSYGYLGL
jgi:hypothetical protein